MLAGVAEGAAAMTAAMILLFALTGLALGIAHFAALRWTVRAYLTGTRSAIAWYVVRLAGSGAILVMLVRIGGPLVLAALVGFLAARLLVVRRGREAA
jgi:F1F0 ATPase subunit 2